LGEIGAVLADMPPERIRLPSTTNENAPAMAEARMSPTSCQTAPPRTGEAEL